MAILSKVLHKDKTTSLELSSKHHHHHHQKSHPSGSHHSHSHLNPSSKPPVTLHIELELPPIVLYGSPSESTGSIFSGLMRVKILGSSDSPILTPGVLSPIVSAKSVDGPTKSQEDSGKSSTKSSLSSSGMSQTPPDFESVLSSLVAIESATLSLVQTIHLTKPFSLPQSSLCKACNTRKETLARWDVVTAKTSLNLGSHAYPFSYLLPGSLPASSKLGLYQLHLYIKYDLVAEAILETGPVRLELPINISRSILRGPDRNSLRVFPPTDVTTSAVLPNVVYPKLQFPIELKIDNVTSEKGDRRWRMRKLLWRIEEAVKIRASACEKHENKLIQAEESQKKALLIKELKRGGQTTQESKSNVHHSTIVTGSFFGNSPTILQQRLLQQRRQQQQQTAIDEEPERETVPHEDARAAFDEDFRITSPVLRQGETGVTGGAGSSLNSRGSLSRSTPTQQPATEIEGAPVELENHLYYEETRTVSHGEIKSGWKSDFSGRGRIELVADISAIGLLSGLVRYTAKKSSLEETQPAEKMGLRNGATISCDIDDPSLGIYVGHTLVVEVVIAEELMGDKSSRLLLLLSMLKPTRLTASMQLGLLDALRPVDSVSLMALNSSTSSASPSTSANQVGVLSGTARVLRMQFKLPFTERSGLGIAWDDEVPPTYDNVLALSPPTYLDLELLSPAVSSLSSPQGTHGTPGILCGLGDTPVTGIYGLMDRNGVDLNERIQELTI